MSSAYPAIERCQPLAVCSPSCVHVTCQHVAEDGVGSAGFHLTCFHHILCVCVCLFLSITSIVPLLNFEVSRTPYVFTVFVFLSILSLNSIAFAHQNNSSAQLRPKGRLVIFLSLCHSTVSNQPFDNLLWRSGVPERDVLCSTLTLCCDCFLLLSFQSTCMLPSFMLASFLTLSSSMPLCPQVCPSLYSHLI